MELVIAGISLGFLGSFHCIGMCGPIALALPVNHYSRLKKTIAILLYNAGRIITYTLMGLLFGLLGQTFFMGGFQQVVSVGIGILLLLSVFFLHNNHLKIPAVAYRFINNIKLSLGKLFSQKDLKFLFLIGVLNGLLPCGLVYLGIAGSISSGHFLKGAGFMFYFGVGTVPAMYAVAFLGQFITLKNRNRVRKAMPVVISAMAVMLIIRGMNLGIPYLSPAFEKKSHAVSCCHTTQTKSCPVKSNLQNK